MRHAPPESKLCKQNWDDWVHVDPHIFTLVSEDKKDADK